MGTFRTTLTTPEIDYVRRVAQGIKLHHGQAYKLAYGLADWAGWVIHLLGDNSGSTPPVVKRVAKGWGRSVLGRFAMRKSSLIGERPATHLGWHIENGHDLDTGEALEVISFDGIEYTYRKDTPGPESFPAVLAFVEGYVRRAPRRAAGLTDAQAHLLQVNTDGWWEQKRRQSRQVADAESPLALQRHQASSRERARGPRSEPRPHTVRTKVRRCAERRRARR